MGPAEEADALLDIAETAIASGLAGRRPTAPAVGLLPAALQRPGGVFVTLKVDGELNGCIGSLEGVEPLGHAVARHAWSAAFADPRLPALRDGDLDGLAVEISLLSPLVPLSAASHEELAGAVRPGVDGLLVAAGRRQGVFLPAVWEQLPEVAGFLDHLWRKAGFRPGEWPPRMRSWRFTTTKVARPARRGPRPSQAA